MTKPSYDNSSAVVVLPAMGGGRLRDKALRAWLSRARLSRVDRRQGDLRRILAETGKAMPEEGLAALRFWGQTGDRPMRWMAAADPVYFEPRLDHLCLHAIDGQSLSQGELGQLVDHLQQSLAEEGACGFVRLGPYCYVTAPEPFATATLSAHELDGSVPNEHLPAGIGAERQRRLQSEMEMALHDHPVNQARQANGLSPVNSFWLWGGGVAPGQVTEPAPPLFADDALLAGYWESFKGVVYDWPGSIDNCIKESVAGFVAVVPEAEDDGEVLEFLLHELRSALRSRRLGRLILLFRDGLRAEVRPRDSLRVWRKSHSLLDDGTEEQG